MAEGPTFARAIKRAETGSFEGNYKSARVGQRPGRIIGAYGIASEFWDALAAQAGLEGANWRDPAAQDAVAESAFKALYEKYGDWRLVAIAWKAGEAVADAVAANPALLKDQRLVSVKEYAQKVMRFASEVVGTDQPTSPDGTPVRKKAFPINMDFALPAPVEGEESGTVAPQTVATQAPPSAAHALTGMLRAMKKRQLSFLAPGEGTPPEETMTAEGA